MNRAYRGTGPSNSWFTEAGFLAGTRTNEDLLRNDIKTNPEGRFLKLVDVAQVPTQEGAHSKEQEPLGYVWVQPSTSDGEWYLGSLTINPDHQNAGYGKFMLALAEEWIKRKGGSRIRITVVNVREALIDWYVQRGYYLTQEVEPFPYDDTRFGTPLRDDLSFVVMKKNLDDVVL
ncbi:hypothetical protein CBS101457_003066 [Exobasidium rhododendri]|nr:hypothetical protein CBS101457_003066 [Exobasidium rhododendri]